MKKFFKNPALVGLATISFVAFILLAHLSVAFIWVEYEKSSAAELYSAEVHSPNGPEESWEQMEENIKDEFSTGSWAIRIVSGNVDTDISIIVVISLISSGVLAFIALDSKVSNIRRQN